MIKTWQERIVTANPPYVDPEEINKAMLEEIDELRAKLAALEAQDTRLKAELNDAMATIELVAAGSAAPVPRMTGAALASQEPVAEVLLVDGEKVIDASMAFFDSVELGTKLYLAAGAAPVQQEPEPIQVCRLMKKEEGIWVAASEFYAGHPDQKWVELVSTNPGSWSIQRRVTGKQIADGLAKALAGTPPALEVTECQWSFEDDDSGTWRSSCGELWSFIDGGPNENRVTYCHHCGGKVSNAAAAPVQQEQAGFPTRAAELWLTKNKVAMHEILETAPLEEQVFGGRVDPSYVSGPMEEAPAAEGYVQPVPDHCDRITWRNSYYHLPLPAPAAKVPEEPRIDINDLSGMIAAVIKEQTP